MIENLLGLLLASGVFTASVYAFWKIPDKPDWLIVLLILVAALAFLGAYGSDESLISEIQRGQRSLVLLLP